MIVNFMIFFEVGFTTVNLHYQKYKKNKN